MAKQRITGSYAEVRPACETLSDRAWLATQKRVQSQARERELDLAAERAVVDAVLGEPEKWNGARATDIVGEHLRQRADLAENDPTIDKNRR